MKELIFEYLTNLLEKLMQRLGIKIKEKVKISNLNNEISEAHDAVDNNDTDKINRIMKTTVVMILASILVGCTSTKTVYLDLSQKIEPITYEGTEGFFVPKSKMHEIVDMQIKYKYYYEKYGPISN